MANNIYGLDEKFFEKPVEEINPWDEYAKALKGEPVKTEEGKDGERAMETEAAVVSEVPGPSMETVVYESTGKKKVSVRKKGVKIDSDEKSAVNSESFRLINFRLPESEYSLLKHVSVLTGKSTTILLREFIRTLKLKYSGQLKDSIDSLSNLSDQ